MNQTDFKAFFERLRTEIVYLRYTFENCVLKSIPITRRKREFWVKFKGEEAFKAKSGSELVADITLGGEEITEKEYNEF